MEFGASTTGSLAQVPCTCSARGHSFLEQISSDIFFKGRQPTYIFSKSERKAGRGGHRGLGQVMLTLWPYFFCENIPILAEHLLR